MDTVHLVFIILDLPHKSFTVVFKEIQCVQVLKLS